MVYSKKQRYLLKLWQSGALKRINLLEGSVRSGKTWISLVLWAFWVLSMPREANFLMAAKTLASLKRNILEVLECLVGSDNFTYSLSKKEGRLFGRRIFLEGASDSRAESKIRGMTLSGAYCDELSLFSEDFFVMLLARLSEAGAKVFATTNPDSPRHWLKRNFIDRQDEIDMLVVKFTLDDNCFLDKQYVNSLKKEYTGVFYDRYILGLWKAAEGAIYRQFADNPEKFIIDDINQDDISFATIGVDFGGKSSAHSFVCSGFLKGMRSIVTLDEFYHKGVLSPKQLEDEFVSFVLRCKEKYKIYDVYCDSAETTLIQGLENAAYKSSLGVDIRNAKKGRVLDRIRFYNRLMSHGRYFVLRRCKHLIEAFMSAVWDNRGTEDRRLDDGSINVDSLDALEYSTEDYMSDLICQ